VLNRIELIRDGSPLSAAFESPTVHSGSRTIAFGEGVRVPIERHGGLGVAMALGDGPDVDAGGDERANGEVP
jgi:hypothetical protein